jgi:hypothetical protein
MEAWRHRQESNRTAMTMTSETVRQRKLQNDRAGKNQPAAARNLRPSFPGNDCTERILAVKDTWLENHQPPRSVPDGSGTVPKDKLDIRERGQLQSGRKPADAGLNGWPKDGQ